MPSCTSVSCVISSNGCKTVSLQIALDCIAYHSPCPFIHDLAEAEIQVVGLSAVFRDICSLRDLDSCNAVRNGYDAFLTLYGAYHSATATTPG